MTFFTAYFNPSTVLSHNVVCDPQPETRSFLFPVEKKGSNAVQIIFTDTYSAVADLDED
jgi:hypothetical protein